MPSLANLAKPRLPHPAITRLGLPRVACLDQHWFPLVNHREQLRQFFEVNRYWITLAALTALADEGQVERKQLAAAIAKYGLDANKPNPREV